MLSKKALLEKLVGTKVLIYTLEPITIQDVPPHGNIYYVIKEVGSDVFTYEVYSTVNAFPKRVGHISIDAVKHISATMP